MSVLGSGEIYYYFAWNKRLTTMLGKHYINLYSILWNNLNPLERGHCAITECALFVIDVRNGSRKVDLRRQGGEGQGGSEVVWRLKSARRSCRHRNCCTHVAHSICTFSIIFMGAPDGNGEMRFSHRISAIPLECPGFLFNQNPCSRSRYVPFVSLFWAFPTCLLSSRYGPGEREGHEKCYYSLEKVRWG